MVQELDTFHYSWVITPDGFLAVGQPERVRRVMDKTDLEQKRVLYYHVIGAFGIIEASGILYNDLDSFMELEQKYSSEYEVINIATVNGLLVKRIE